MSRDWWDGNHAVAVNTSHTLVVVGEHAGVRAKTRLDELRDCVVRKDYAINGVCDMWRRRDVYRQGLAHDQSLRSRWLKLSPSTQFGTAALL